MKGRQSLLLLMDVFADLIELLIAGFERSFPVLQILLAASEFRLAGSSLCFPGRCLFFAQPQFVFELLNRTVERFKFVTRRLEVLLLFMKLSVLLVKFSACDLQLEFCRMEVGFVIGQLHSSLRLVAEQALWRE